MRIEDRRNETKKSTQVPIRRTGIDTQNTIHTETYMHQANTGK